MSALRSGRKPEDILPGPMPVPCETTRFKNLDKGGKVLLKELVTDAVTKYWKEYRQIPCPESFSELRKHLIEKYDQECGVLLKDEVELKNYLQTYTIATINKLLKEEIR